ncbi:type II secretion system protein N [Eionea flava]
MKAWVVWPVSVLAICLIAVGFFPIQWLLGQSAFSFGKVNIGAVSGNGWQGYKVRDVSVDHRGYRIEAGNIRVRYADVHLLSRSICVHVRSLTTEKMMTGNGRICYHWGDQSWSISDVSIQSSGQLVAELTGIELQGQLFAHINYAHISAAHQLYNIDGEVTWNEAQWFNGEQWIALGQLLATVDSLSESQYVEPLLAAESPQIEINIMDIDSPLQVSIKTIIAAQGITSIEGYIQPYADIGQSLRDSLQLVASSQQGQRYYYYYQW